MVPPKQVERGDSLYGPSRFPGARGLGVPASGGSRRRLATMRWPPRVPAMAPFAPGTAVPSKCAVLPLTQSTSPVSLGPSSRSFAPSVPWTFVKFTNWPDCLTSNDCPSTGAAAGAVGGRGAPVARGGGRGGAGGGGGGSPGAGDRARGVVAARDGLLGLLVLARAEHDRDHRDG